MSEADRQRWNVRYRNREAPERVSAFLDDVADLLPRTGRALDVAGGAGRNAVWLARRGLDVTLVDVSDEALELARRRVADSEVDVALLRRDLDEDLPRGPWHLIVCLHYLDRSLFPKLIAELATGGTMAVALATVKNLDAHDRPPLPYLVGEGEAPELVAGLEIVHHREGWFDGRHETHLVARA